MPPVTEESVLNALSAVQDPDLRRDIVSLGFVKNVRICDGNVAFAIELTTPACPVKDALREEAESVVGDLDGVTSVSVDMTARVRGRPQPDQALIPGVRHVIAIASGKGGVGKSTVAANVAVALSRSGARVGLLDADVYGPSQPAMMGTREKPLLTRDGDQTRMVPVQAHGILLMSLGFLLDDDKAVVWRGPMVAGTVRQMLADVTWGDLDYLIVDLPPGTGDAPLTLAQQVPLSGVVVVMTPQSVAREIANKSVAMFRTVEHSSERPIPILGVVENMSGGPFGSGGGEQASQALGVPFLGRIPIDASVCEAGDAGTPVFLAAPESAPSRALAAVAGAIAARVSTLHFDDQAAAPGAPRF